MFYGKNTAWIPAFAGITFLLVALLLNPARAHSFKTAEINIGHPWAPPTAPNATEAQVFLSLMNMGAADQLTGATTSVAYKTELVMPGDAGPEKVMAIDLPNKRGISLRPSGPHIRLTKLKGGLTLGDKFTVKLTFATAAPVDVTVFVEEPGHGH